MITVHVNLLNYFVMPIAQSLSRLQFRNDLPAEAHDTSQDGAWAELVALVGLKILRFFDREGGVLSRSPFALHSPTMHHASPLDTPNDSKPPPSGKTPALHLHLCLACC